MYQISREKMPELLAAVAKEMDLFLPVQNNGITNFGFWTEDADVDLDTLKTVKSPAEKEAIRTLIDKMPNSNLSLEGWGVGKTKERFDDPKWKELSDACLGCGTCTFSCPTCQCYDIKDFNTGNGVQRYRCWDSCMYSDFTMMAAGNNRTTQLQRFRQRFMHKLVYFPDNNDGMYSCVGCGRCVEKCPQSLNIVKVIKRMGGTK